MIIVILATAPGSLAPAVLSPHLSPPHRGRHTAQVLCPAVGSAVTVPLRVTVAQSHARSAARTHRVPVTLVPGVSLSTHTPGLPHNSPRRQHTPRLALSRSPSASGARTHTAFLPHSALTLEVPRSSCSHPSAAAPLARPRPASPAPFLGRIPLPTAVAKT